MNEAAIKHLGARMTRYKEVLPKSRKKSRLGTCEHEGLIKVACFTIPAKVLWYDRARRALYRS
jgi:hypothetical protein